MAFLDFMAPPAHKPELPAEKIDKEYKAMRLKVFLGIYLGYAAYYLVRKNLSFAGADMISLGYLDTSGVGDAMAGLPIAYAVSKFLMGGLSDRSDARKFLTFGLIISALIMIVSKYGFMDIMHIEGIRADASRIASNVVTGVGFLGAGVIFVRDVSIKGLTTAAGIWTTAGVGLAIGAGEYELGIAASIIMVVSQLILHRFFSKLENTANEFTVVVSDTKDSVKNFKDKLASMNISVAKCNITRNKDSTLTLDVTVKKSRMISMDEIMLMIEQNDSIVSIDI